MKKAKAWERVADAVARGGYIMCGAVTWVEGADGKGEQGERWVIAHATFMELKRRGLIQMTTNGLVRHGRRVARWDGVTAPYRTNVTSLS